LDVQIIALGVYWQPRHDSRIRRVRWFEPKERGNSLTQGPAVRFDAQRSFPISSSFCTPSDYPFRRRISSDHCRCRDHPVRVLLLCPMRLLAWNLNHRATQKPIVRSVGRGDPLFPLADVIVLTEYVRRTSDAYRRSPTRSPKSGSNTNSGRLGFSRQNSVLIASRVELVRGEITAPGDCDVDIALRRMFYTCTCRSTTASYSRSGLPDYSRASMTSLSEISTDNPNPLAVGLSPRSATWLYGLTIITFQPIGLGGGSNPPVVPRVSGPRAVINSQVGKLSFVHQ